MVIEAEESQRSTSSQIVLSEEQMRRVDVPGDGSCLFWAVALPYLIQVNNNIDLFNARFERLFGEKKLTHSRHVRRLISEFHSSHHNSDIYDDEILRHLVTRVFRHKLVDQMSRCEEQFYESISIDDFKDMKNEAFITDGTFRNSFKNSSFSLLIEGSDIDLDKLKPQILNEKTIAVINFELDKIGCGELLQKFKFRMYLEAMKSSGSWGGNHEIEMMKRMLGCEILVNFEKRLVPVLENSIICLFNNQQIHYQFFLIKAQFLIEFIEQNYSEEDCLVYLNMGVDEINFQNGSTLLHFAAKNNYAKLIPVLINQGADINVRNSLEQTPLDVAIALNSQSFIAVLVNCARENSNLVNEISAINSKIEIAKKSEPQPLLEYNEDGRNIVHVAAEEGHDVILKQIISWLVEDGHLRRTFIDISIRGKRKQTALHLAAINNRVKAMAILLENEAKVNVRDVNIEGLPDFTPLHCAAEKGQLEAVRLLIEIGKADIHAPDRTKGTPLQRAVRFGQLSVVQYLVGIGADVNSRDQTSISVFSFAAKAGHLNIVSFLVQEGAEINTVDKNNITPLHRAAQSSKWEIVRYLVLSGADPNIESNKYKTPLNRIVLSKQLELASVLIRNGALTNDLSKKQLEYIRRNHEITTSKEMQIKKLLDNLVGSKRLEVANKDSTRDFLPKIYDELMLLSVPVPQIARLFMESEIINDRLFSDRKVNEPDTTRGKAGDVENTKRRIDLVVKAIEELDKINTSLSDNKINDAFLFVGRFVAQNMEILKRQLPYLLPLRYAVAKLPWTQMQFCLVNFISGYLEPEKSDVIYKLATNGARLMKNLKTFKAELEKVDDDINWVGDFPADFKDLREDYELLRDVYSLNRIESYLNPACVFNLSKGDVVIGEQVILRALHVTGECLKSSSMSDKVHHLLLALAPKNVIKIVTSLRDSLSHVEHLHKGNVTENQSFLSDIQKDLTKLKEEINYFLFLKRNLALEIFFKRISQCENLTQAKEVVSGVQSGASINVHFSNKQTEIFNKMAKLIEQFAREIKNPNDIQRMHLTKLEKVVEKHKERMTEVKQQHMGYIEAINTLLYSITKDGEIDSIRKMAEDKKIKLNFHMKSNANFFEEVLESCFVIYNSLEKRNRNINELFWEIFQIIEFEEKRVKSMDRFKTEMSKEMSIFDDEIEQMERSEENVNDILQTLISETHFDSEIKTQFQNEIEIKKEVYHSKNTLIKYYSKIIQIYDNILIFYDYFRDYYNNLNNFFASLMDFYTPNLTTEAALNENKLIKLVRENDFGELLSELNLKDLISEAAFKNLMEKVKLREIISVEEIFNEFEFNKLVEKKIAIDKNFYVKMLKEFRTNESLLKAGSSKKVKDEKKQIIIASLIDEDAFELLVEEIKEALLLNDNIFNALIDNVPFKLKKGETYIIKSFRDFSFSNCKNMLDRLNDIINAKGDSFGKLVKDSIKKDRTRDAPKKSETVKLSERFNEFIASLISDKKSEILNAAVQKLINERVINKILNDKLKKYFFEKLEILTKIFSGEKSDLKLLASLKTDNVRLAVEMLVLNLTETLDQFSLFEPNGLYLDEISPVLVGKNLRNYLAHGYPLINILPTNYHISLIDHFRLFQREFHKKGEFYSGQYLIGKVKIENLSQVEEFYEQNLAILDKKYNLFNAIKVGEVDDFNKLIRNNSLDLKVRNFLGDTLLHCSARANNLSVFQHLLKQGSNLFLKNKYGHTALYLAVAAGSARIIEFLLEKGFDPLFIVKNSETFLHLAVDFGQLDIVKLLLRYGADIAAENKDGEQPIIQAVLCGHDSIVDLLLAAGSDLEWRDKSGKTLLHLATSNFEIVKTLLEKNVNVNAFDRDRNTPLHLACSTGDELVVKLLLDKEAKVNSRNKDGGTALHFAALKGRAKIVELLLLTKKVEIDIATFKKITALHLACFRGHLDVAELLLKNGAKIEMKNGVDMTALHIAAKMGHAHLIDILVEYATGDIDCLGQGVTALHFAAQSEATEVFKKLVEKGANMYLRGINGLSVLHIAADLENIEMMEFMLEKEQLLGKSELVNMIDRKSRTALFSSIETNKIQSLNFLLERNVNFNIEDDDKATPLLFAALKDHTKIVTILLNKGADIEAKDEKGWSLLHAAAQNNNKPLVDKLIKLKMNVNDECKTGITALHLASQYGHMEMVKLLLKHGASIDARRDNGWTALHFASSYGHADIVRYLLKKTAKNDFSDSFALTPVYLAAEQGHIRILQLLLENNNAYVNAVAETKVTALEVAALNEHAACVQLLIENGADVNVTSEYKRTVLHHLAHKGQLEIMKILLANGADVNARDNFDWTVLHLATAGGHFDSVKYLLNNNNKADPFFKSKQGESALHLAANLGFLNIVEEILSYDETKVDLKNVNEYTPLHWAAQSNHVAIVEFLLNKRANINSRDLNGSTALHKAAFNGHLETVRLLLTRGATVNPPNVEGLTPLHCAALNEHVKVVIELIKFDADVNSISKGNHCTPLHYAALKNNVDIVGHLLAVKSIEVNAERLDGDTPLHVAAFLGFFATAEKLIEAGANVNSVDKQGLSPLHLAVQSSSCRIIKLLADSGADMNAAFNGDVTALVFAARRGAVNVVATLLENGADVTNKAIQLAVQLNFIEIFVTLMQHGASGSEGTALHKAIRCKNLPILRLILGTPLLINLWDEQLNSMMNAVDRDGKTPLICAAEEGYLAAVDLLLCFKMVKVNERTTRDGMTALHLSALNGHEKIVQMLISKRADANLRDVRGRTAFDLVEEKLISDEAEKYEAIAGLLLSLTE